jgi:hypothetical protein
VGLDTAAQQPIEPSGGGANMTRCGVGHTSIFTQIPTSCLQHLAARDTNSTHHEDSSTKMGVTILVAGQGFATLLVNSSGVPNLGALLILHYW